MKLSQYDRGEETATEWDIPDDNVEEFLRDRMGFLLADSWQVGDVRAERFDSRKIPPGRALAPCIVVVRTADRTTATLYEHPLEMADHIRFRFQSLPTGWTPLQAAIRDELSRLDAKANDYLTLYTELGGRITGTHRLAAADAIPELLQKTKALVDELRRGVKSVQGHGPFIVSMVDVAEFSGNNVAVFALCWEGKRQQFELFPPGRNIHMQQAGLFGGLFGSSFNQAFQDSLPEMSAEEYSVFAQPLLSVEADRTSLDILANRPVMTAMMRLHPADPDLRRRLIEFAMHFAIALLE